MLHIKPAPPVDTGPNPSEPNAASATPDGSTIESLVSLTRSCVTCRRRKLKCDRKKPCTRCTKQSSECVYPSSTDKFKRKRKTPNSELLTRLGKLEDTLKDWGAHIDDEGILITDHHDPGKKNQRQQLHRGLDSFPHNSARTMIPSLDKASGVLVVKDGRARYIENQFWARMAGEIADLRELVDDPLSEEEDLFDPDRQDSDSVHPFPAIKNTLLFGSHSSPANFKALYPSPSQVFILWETYRDNMDPLIKILHRPTVERLFFDVSSNQNAISPEDETLIFAIFLGAAVSLTPEQCATLLQDSRENLIRRFRLATEEALTKAELLKTSSLSVLQAFVIFLTCMRFHDDIRVIQALTSLAIHLAQALGVHKDGTNFGLSPFDTEVRRRIWWYLSVLESRSLEDTATNPVFPISAWDTQFPMNINDDEIWPDMTETPSPREGCTDMTICLMRFELGETWRKLIGTEIEAVSGQSWTYTLEQKDKILSTCRKRVEERYLTYFDTDIPLYWMGATISRIVLSKMWLLIHSPFGLPKGAQEPAKAQTERLFDAAVEIVESWYLLGDDPRAANCRWLLRSYVQWHGMILILLQLCVRPLDSKSNHAWQVINKSYHGRVVQQMDSQSSMLLKPLQGLMAKVQSHRDKQLGTRHDEAPPAAGPRPMADINGEHVTSLGSDPHVIAATGAGRGLSNHVQDLTNIQYPAQAIGTLPSDLLSSTTDQMDWTAEDIQAWLATEQEMQQQLDFADWIGWYNSSNLG